MKPDNWNRFAAGLLAILLCLCSFSILYYRCCAAILQKQAEKAACGTADCF